jgi:hypothetical protein
MTMGMPASIGMMEGAVKVLTEVHVSTRDAPGEVLWERHVTDIGEALFVQKIGGGRDAAGDDLARYYASIRHPADQTCRLRSSLAVRALP